MLLYFYVQLGLPSTLIQTENGAFENAFQTEGICVVVWTESILKMEIFTNYDITPDDNVISLTELSSTANIKLVVIAAFSNFSGVDNVEGKH